MKKTWLTNVCNGCGSTASGPWRYNGVTTIQTEECSVKYTYCLGTRSNLIFCRLGSSWSVAVAIGNMVSKWKWNWIPDGGLRRKFLLSWNSPINNYFVVQLLNLSTHPHWCVTHPLRCHDIPVRGVTNGMSILTGVRLFSWNGPNSGTDFWPTNEQSN